jgi:hypothetical protein
MPEPHEHNPSGFDAPAGGGGEEEPAAPSGAGGADRFWRQYGAARGGRTGTRNGGDQTPAAEDGQGATDHECLEWCPICRGAEVVRATTPPELREQWQTVQRDALVMVRALIDAYLQRLGDGPGRRAAHRVEDIPIE